MLTLTQLDKMQNQYQFTYPKLYRQMVADGFMDWGLLGKDWLDVVYPTLKENPPFLLYHYGIELIDFDMLTTYYEALNQSSQDDLLWSIFGRYFILVPFALSESDCYCFIYAKDNTPDPNQDNYILWQYLKQNQADNVPIAMIYHDDDVIITLAKNIQDFMFIKSLEIVTDIYDGALLTDGDIHQNLANCLNSHLPYLTKTQGDVLKSLYQNPSSPQSKV